MSQGSLRTAGTTPSLDLPVEANLHRCLAELSQQQLIHSARDISDGGTAVALAEACFCHGIGMRANLSRTPDLPAEWDLFGETASQFIEADSLNYLSLEGLKQACDGVEANEYCTACYTGEYPTQWVDVAEILPATAVR